VAKQSSTIDLSLGPKVPNLLEGTGLEVLPPVEFHTPIALNEMESKKSDILSDLKFSWSLLLYWILQT